LDEDASEQVDPFPNGVNPVNDNMVRSSSRNDDGTWRMQVSPEMRAKVAVPMDGLEEGSMYIVDLDLSMPGTTPTSGKCTLFATADPNAFLNTSSTDGWIANVENKAEEQHVETSFWAAGETAYLCMGFAGVEHDADFDVAVYVVDNLRLTKAEWRMPDANL
jgi:L-ascorbate metabolism protein UlaG (beta-lactamase superfamily)